MKALVTGGGGFIGLALIRKLIASGYEVATFSRNYYPVHKELGIEIHQGDLNDLNALQVACNDKEIVFHVASKTGLWGSSAEFLNANVKGTGNVINACLKKGIGKLVYTSSASVVIGGSDINGGNESLPYPLKPIFHYSATKAIAEQMVLAANEASLKTISLRPHIVWGPGDRHIIPGILKRAASGNLRKIGYGEHYVDVTYIDNLIDAHILAANVIEENPACCGKAFFITNGEPVETWNFMNAIVRAAGYPEIKKSIPKNVVMPVAWIIEVFFRLFRIQKEPFLTRFAIKELCSSHWFDILAARTILGYSPAISVSEGLSLLSLWFRTNRIIGS
jgi:2-alkyl-3-oxoalkanoate reductase